MLISVLNIKLTCESHKAIQLNYINTRTNVAVVLRVPSILHVQSQHEWLERAVYWTTDMRSVRVIRHANEVQYVEAQDHTFLSPLSP